MRSVLEKLFEIQKRMNIKEKFQGSFSNIFSPVGTPQNDFEIEEGDKIVKNL